MYIDRLIVRGYRSLYHIDLPLKPGKNVLVGKNNAGKSNIVDALNIVLGERYPTYVDIDIEDFFTDLQGKRSESFWIVCSIKGNDWNSEALKCLTRLYRTTGRTDDYPIGESADIIEHSLNSIFFEPEDLDRSEKETLLKNNLSTFVNELNHAVDMAFVFRARRDTSSDEGFSKDFRFIYRYDQNGRSFWRVVWGISNEFRQAFLTSAVLRAFRDPDSELRINKWSWYGKLITKAWERARSDNPKLEEELSSAFSQAESVGNEVYSSFSDHLEQAIGIGFRGTKVAFKFANTSASDFHKGVQVYINDGLDAPISRKGAGIQSAVIIGLFSYYCQTQHSNTSVLIVEEPEIFLHPHARRSISRKLDQFIAIKESSGKRNQVVITTHSAEYVQAGDASSIAVVRKTDGKTEIKSFSFDSLNDKAKQRLLRANSGEMFFADKVILCEGAEAYLIPRVADMLVRSTGVLDEHNISVIRVDGKGSFKSYAIALDALGIPWFILADFDFFLKGLSDFLLDQDPLKGTYSQLVQAIQKLQSGNSTQLGGVKKTLKDKTSNLRKEFIQAMDLFRIVPSDYRREEVFSLWDKIITNSTGKIGKEALVDELNEQLEDFLEKLFKEKNIWILRQGELEDYATGTKGGDLLSGQKVQDSRLLEACLDPDANLEEYFELDEFQKFLRGIIAVEKQEQTSKVNENNLPF
jgi:energy-coupling factor transporter ATP-binding protein EcfA2